MLSSLLALLVAALLALPAVAVADVDVTCGDQFAGTGHLTGDCTGSITIDAGTLYLEGHTISGTGLAAVDCVGGCRIEGPGTIVSEGSTFGISGADRIRVTNVSVSGHSVAGIKAGELGRIRIDDSIIEGNGVGVRGPLIVVMNSHINNNAGSGVESTLRGVKIFNSFVLNNGGDGVATELGTDYANRAKVLYTTITGNGHFGLIGKNLATKYAVVRQNGQDADCGDTVPCADVASVSVPRFRLSGCETSMQIPEEFSGPIPFGLPWGICTLDE